MKGLVVNPEILKIEEFEIEDNSQSDSILEAAAIGGEKLFMTTSYRPPGGSCR
jgi:hypothetical protein